MNFSIISFIFLVCISVGRSWDEFQLSVLNEHNRLRALHGTPPLKLDRRLSDECELYAKILKKKGYMEHHHKAGSEFGECLSGPWGWGWAKSVENFGVWTTQMFYSEIQYYDWSTPHFSTGKGGNPVGHFTTMVWKQSTNLGVGRAMPSGPNITDGMIVFRYTPIQYWPVNWAKNILPLLPGNDINTYKKNAG